MTTTGEAALSTAAVNDFESFAGAVSPRLLRSARLLTGDRHLAEDLVQATLLKIYLRWSRSGSWDSPVAYAQRALYTTFCSWRGRRWSGEHSTGVLPDSAVPAVVGADAGAVDAALRDLPRRQRAVVVARFYDDLSVRQTAELLGIAEGTVKSQTARGLDRLRTVLDSYALKQGVTP